MSQPSTPRLKIRSLLLSPQHAAVSASSLPLLTRLQSLLNESYTATYCAHPSIFGTSHLRLADPAQLADIIGRDGFTIALLLVKERNGNGHDVVEPVATGSVKNFGSGDVEQYAQWSKNISGTQWRTADADKRTTPSNTGDDPEVKSSQRQAMPEKGQEGLRMEITAFAVSPAHQGMGLGARVLADMEWLMSRFGNSGMAKMAIAPAFEGAVLPLASEGKWTTIEGIDLEILKASYGQAAQNFDSVTKIPLESGLNRTKRQKLVLMSIRELGIEEYYKRRGYKSVWAGTVPIGMWDCLEECTMVYMEREL